MKIVARTLPLTGQNTSIQLFDKKDIQVLKKHFNYLHIGYVQVAIKPLTRLGLNKPICLLLRDGRHNKLTDALLGLVESNIIYGPIYFTCFPNYSLSLADSTIIQALTLNLQTKYFDMNPLSHPLAITYRFAFKAMTTTLDPQCILQSPKGETLLLLANEQLNSIATPRLLKWQDILQSQEWEFTLQKPKPIHNTVISQLTIIYKL